MAHLNKLSTSGLKPKNRNFSPNNSNDYEFNKYDNSMSAGRPKLKKERFKIDMNSSAINNSDYNDVEVESKHLKSSNDTSYSSNLMKMEKEDLSKLANYNICSDSSCSDITDQQNNTYYDKHLNKKGIHQNEHMEFYDNQDRKSSIKRIDDVDHHQKVNYARSSRIESDLVNNDCASNIDTSSNSISYDYNNTKQQPTCGTEPASKNNNYYYYNSTADGLAASEKTSDDTGGHKYNNLERKIERKKEVDPEESTVSCGSNSNTKGLPANLRGRRGSKVLELFCTTQSFGEEGDTNSNTCIENYSSKLTQEDDSVCDSNDDLSASGGEVVTHRKFEECASKTEKGWDEKGGEILTESEVKFREHEKIINTKEGKKLSEYTFRTDEKHLETTYSFEVLGDQVLRTAKTNRRLSTSSSMRKEQDSGSISDNLGVFSIIGVCDSGVDNSICDTDKDKQNNNNKMDKLDVKDSDDFDVSFNSDTSDEESDGSDELKSKSDLLKDKIDTDNSISFEETLVLSSKNEKKKKKSSSADLVCNGYDSASGTSVDRVEDSDSSHPNIEVSMSDNNDEVIIKNNGTEEQVVLVIDDKIDAADIDKKEKKKEKKEKKHKEKKNKDKNKTEGSESDNVTISEDRSGDVSSKKEKKSKKDKSKKIKSGDEQVSALESSTNSSELSSDVSFTFTINTSEIDLSSTSEKTEESSSSVSEKKVKKSKKSKKIESEVVEEHLSVTNSEADIFDKVQEKINISASSVELEQKNANIIIDTSSVSVKLDQQETSSVVEGNVIEERIVKDSNSASESATINDDIITEDIKPSYTEKTTAAEDNKNNDILHLTDNKYDDLLNHEGKSREENDKVDILNITEQQQESNCSSSSTSKSTYSSEQFISNTTSIASSVQGNNSKQEVLNKIESEQTTLPAAALNVETAFDLSSSLAHKEEQSLHEKENIKLSSAGVETSHNKTTTEEGIETPQQCKDTNFIAADAETSKNNQTKLIDISSVEEESKQSISDATAAISNVQQQTFTLTSTSQKINMAEENSMTSTAQSMSNNNVEKVINNGEFKLSTDSDLLSGKLISGDIDKEKNINITTGYGVDKVDKLLLGGNDSDKKRPRESETGLDKFLSEQETKEDAMDYSYRSTIKSKKTLDDDLDEFLRDDPSSSRSAGTGAGNSFKVMDEKDGSKTYEKTTTYIAGDRGTTDDLIKRILAEARGELVASSSTASAARDRRMMSMDDEDNLGTQNEGVSSYEQRSQQRASQRQEINHESSLERNHYQSHRQPHAHEEDAFATTEQPSLYERRIASMGLDGGSPSRNLTSSGDSVTMGGLSTSTSKTGTNSNRYMLTDEFDDSTQYTSRGRAGQLSSSTALVSHPRPFNDFEFGETESQSSGQGNYKRQQFRSGLMQKQQAIYQDVNQDEDMLDDEDEYDYAAFNRRRNMQEQEEYIPDEEFEPSKADDTDRVVQERTEEIRQVVDNQHTVLQRLKSASDSFDELTNEIKEIKQQFLESQIRRSSIMDDIDTERAFMAQIDYENQQHTQKTGTGGYQSYYSKKKVPRYLEHDEEEFESKYRPPASSTTSSRKMIELDKELEDDVLYKSRPSGLAIGGRAYTVAGGYGADRSSYLDSSSGVGGGSGYKSKYMEDLDLDSDMRSITSGDTGRSSSRYGSGYMSATTTTRGRRGRSMSMYEGDLEMGSEATSLVPTNGMSSTRSRFSSKYGVSGLDGEEDDNEDAASEASSYRSPNLPSYRKYDYTNGDSTNGTSSYTSPYKSKYGNGGSSRSASTSRLSNLTRSKTVDSYESPSSSYDRPSYGSSKYSKYSSPATTSSFSSRFLNKVREKKAAGEDLSVRDKPFSSRFLNKSVDLTGPPSFDRPSFGTSSSSLFSSEDYTSSSTLRNGSASKTTDSAEAVDSET